MMKKYNVGMIGYGWATGAHIAAINGTTLARVTAVYSSRPLERTRRPAARFGQCLRSSLPDAI